MEKKHLVIFDLDGTLADTSKGIYECYRFALKSLGRQEPTYESLDGVIGGSLLKNFETKFDLTLDEAKEAVRRKQRIKREKAITAEEAKRVAGVRSKKYILVSQLASWLDKKKVAQRSIEKSNGVKVLLNREIKEGLRVEENKEEIKKIEADVIKWNKTIKVADEKKVVLEAQIEKIEAQIAKLNTANKARRTKRRAVLKEKNSKSK